MQLGVCGEWRGSRVIRWSTAVAVLGVADVAVMASYEHAYDLVRAHGEAGWTARMIPLTVDGLIRERHPDREHLHRGVGIRHEAGRGAAAGHQQLRHQSQPQGLRQCRTQPVAAPAFRGDREEGSLWEVHHDPYDVSQI